MKRVYSSHDFVIVGFLKDILETHNIRCFIKNEHLTGAVGELPPIECWPELWLAEDSDFPMAQGLIDSALVSSKSRNASWLCPGCGELIEGQFTVCWKCGQANLE